jgi:hypothetical protein
MEETVMEETEGMEEEEEEGIERFFFCPSFYLKKKNRMKVPFRVPSFFTRPVRDSN